MEIRRDIPPTATRRAETRIPKCVKYELQDGYRLALQGGDSDATMVALAVGTHEHVNSFLDGHKGYVFDKNTGQLRELRLGTATETAVEMVPSVELQSEQAVPVEPNPPLFGDFTDAMLLQLWMKSKTFPKSRSGSFTRWSATAKTGCFWSATPLNASSRGTLNI